jgi:hypothetical protein
MRSLRSVLFNKAVRWLALACLIGVSYPVMAQGAIDIVSFEAERGAEEVTVSAQLQFELSSTVEDALLKGIPMVFVAEAEVFKERWYWADKSMGGATRQFRLAFQPLTRHWRLNVSTGLGPASGLGLALNQSYDTLQQALAAIKRIARWKVVNTTDLDPSLRYRLEFRFRLDLGQLPRPFQIGALGQSEWDIAVGRSVILAPEAAK